MYLPISDTTAPAKGPPEFYLQTIGPSISILITCKCRQYILTITDKCRQYIIPITDKCRQYMTTPEPLENIRTISNIEAPAKGPPELYLEAIGPSLSIPITDKYYYIPANYKTYVPDRTLQPLLKVLQGLVRGPHFAHGRQRFSHRDFFLLLWAV